MESQTNFEVFYDGNCPLCMREINMLQRLDRNRRIDFTDIATDNFDPLGVGVDMDTLMASIHGRMPSGQLVTGVEVFRQLYSRVGFSPLVALTRMPGVRQILDAAYNVFAKNRLRLTGRCDAETCAIPQKS